MSGQDSFTRLLLAEWTKLRSVKRWVMTLLGTAALIVALSSLAASGNIMDPGAQIGVVSGPRGEPVADTFYFVHQPVTGDATLTVRVASLTTEPVSDEVNLGDGDRLARLDDPNPFADPAAGIMMKDGTQSGSSYASLLLTATQGVHMQWDFAADRRGSASVGDRWLRLERTGSTITGYESGDGAQWQKVATATPINLPPTVEIGFYVSSPAAVFVSRSGGSSSVGEQQTSAEAAFENVRLGSDGSWQGESVGDAPDGSHVTHIGGTYTVEGAGKIGPRPADDDMVQLALVGVIGGLIPLAALGVLFATSEYRRGMIRTTFAVAPRRGRVLAAKATVLGATSFLVGLVGAVGSFLVAIPTLHAQGFTAPAFPEPSLWDGPVLRALLLTAGFMAGVAVVGLAIGVLVRHTAAAVTITILLVLAPLIIGTILPGTSPRWLMYSTLAGGMATQRAATPTITLAEPWSMIGPWAGIGVVMVWVAATLVLAWWQLQKRDA